MNDTSSLAAPAFDRAVRGYSTRSVDAWTAAATHHIQRLERDLAEMRTRLDARAAEEGALVRTLTSAHLMAERLVEETNDEAERRKAAARAQAAAVVASAEREAAVVVAEARDRARRELALLDMERTELRAELDQLRGLLHSERIRARDGLAAALAAVDAGLRREIVEVRGDEAGTEAYILRVVAS